MNKALIWERRSGAIFKKEKTAYIYFIKNARLLNNKTINIKGINMVPQQEVKILGILMDLCLRYKNYMTKVGTKELKIIMALKRMRSLAPVTVR